MFSLDSVSSRGSGDEISEGVSERKLNRKRADREDC